MSQFPLDIVSYDSSMEFELNEAINICNAIQNEFHFSNCTNDLIGSFNLIHLEENDGDEFFESVLEAKKTLPGYFPHLLFVSPNPLTGGGWFNLFAYTDSDNGISIITTKDVEVTIIPKGHMTAYIVYYFSRALIKFLFLGKYNHDKPSKNGCLFDFMENKKDILKSMRPNAICDNCRREISQHETKLSNRQFAAINNLLAKSGELLQEPKSDDQKTRIFIGSSTEGLAIARKIKSGLKYDAHVDTWADGIFDQPGMAYIEILEEILNVYDFGIFVFNPDDKVFSRGKISSIPRDNVIFEYGMFLGRHTRRKAFFIIPRGIDIKIMTDVLGITCLDYDPSNPNLQSAVQ